MCDHDDVKRRGDAWACVTCGEGFSPQTDVELILESVQETAADLLWRFHARAAETYGSLADTMLPGQADEPPQDPATCQHAFGSEAGTCIKCGTSFYLGNG